MRRTKFAAWIPSRKTPAVRHAISDQVVKRQVGHRAADIPFGGIHIAGLQVAVRKVIIDVRPPQTGRVPRCRYPPA